MSRGIEPYPRGRKTKTEEIEAGERREEIETGLDKRTAIACGRALRDRMKGNGWVLHVWQNMGWHYMVRLGVMNVHVSRYRGVDSYHTLFGYRHAGRPELTDAKSRSFKDPNRAVQAQVRFAKEHLRGLQEALDSCKTTLESL